MPDIPLPTGLRGDRNFPKQVEILDNCYMVQGDLPTIQSRPVVRSISDSPGRCRGSGKYKGELYQVANDRLIKITLINPNLAPSVDNVLITEVGTIAGTEDCILVPSFTQMVILRKGSGAYVYDDVNGLRAITDPQFVVSISVDYDPNGNWVFIPADGDPFIFCSDVNLFTDPSNAQFRFADAQEFIDLNKVVAVRRRQIYVGGGSSFERLAYNPDLDTYVPVSGATSNYGYVGGLTRFADTFMFLGVGIDGGYSFFIMDERARPIPNTYVNDLLLNYDLNQLENIKGYSFRWKDRDFAVFYLPDITLVFSEDFMIWHSGVIGEAKAPWRVCFFQQAYGYTWTGDLYGSTIGIMSEDELEYDENVEGCIQTYLRGPSRSNFIIRRIFLDANCGVNSTAQKIGLQVSQNGAVFGKVHYQSLGGPGEYNRELSWGPIGKFDNAMCIRLVWSGNIRLSFDRLEYQ